MGCCNMWPQNAVQSASLCLIEMLQLAKTAGVDLGRDAPLITVPFLSSADNPNIRAGSTIP